MREQKVTKAQRSSSHEHCKNKVLDGSARNVHTLKLGEAVRKRLTLFRKSPEWWNLVEGVPSEINHQFCCPCTRVELIPCADCRRLFSQPIVRTKLSCSCSKRRPKGTKKIHKRQWVSVKTRATPKRLAPFYQALKSLHIHIQVTHFAPSRQPTNLPHSALTLGSCASNSCDVATWRDLPLPPLSPSPLPPSPPPPLPLPPPAPPRPRI